MDNNVLSDLFGLEDKTRELEERLRFAEKALAIVIVFGVLILITLVGHGLVPFSLGGPSA